MHYFRKNIALYVSFLLTVLFVALIHFRLDDKGLTNHIHSDTLYLSTFFRDIFIDNSKDVRWHLPAASCFFPDLILFFTVHFFTANFIKAMFFTGILLNILLILGFYLLIKESVNKISPLFISVGINLMLLYHTAALYTNDYTFVSYLILTNYHIGAYIASLFCLYFAVRYLRRDKRGYLVALVLIYALTFSSDFLTIFYLIIPLLAISFLLFKKEYKRQSIQLLISNLLGFVLGLILYGLVATNKAFYLPWISNLTFNFNRVADSYLIMFSHHFMYLKAMDVRGLTMSICVVSFVVSLVIFSRKLFVFYNADRINKNELLEMIYLLIVATQVIIIYNAPAINGVYSDGSILRYNVSAFYISILNVGYLVYKFSQLKKCSKIASAFSIIVILCFFFIGLKETFKTDIRKDAHRYFSYYPEYIKDIDELCIKYNMKFGLADFWEARRITMLSKQGVRVYQTYKDLCPYFHTVNKNWYYRTNDKQQSPPVFQFVLPDRLIDSLVYQKLQGHIIDTLKTNNVTLIHTDPFKFETNKSNIIFIDSK